MHFIDQPAGFVVAVLIFQLIPGPGTLTILRATASQGLQAGFASVAGTLLGGLLCMLAAASGLEAVFRGQPEATLGLKWAGALYLAWMGWRLMGPASAAVSAKSAGTGTGTGTAPPSLGSQLRRALAVSLTNPKVILFYFALLPLFFRPPFSAASLATMLCCVTGISLVYQSALVLAGRAAARRLATLPSAQRLAQRLAGLLFVGFALKLLVAS